MKFSIEKAKGGFVFRSLGEYDRVQETVICNTLADLVNMITLRTGDRNIANYAQLIGGLSLDIRMMEDAANEGLEEIIGEMGNGTDN